VLLLRRLGRHQCGGGTTTVQIREDSAGHYFGEGNPKTGERISMTQKEITMTTVSARFEYYENIFSNTEWPLLDQQNSYPDVEVDCLSFSVQHALGRSKELGILASIVRRLATNTGLKFWVVSCGPIVPDTPANRLRLGSGSPPFDSFNSDTQILVSENGIFVKCQSLIGEIDHGSAVEHLRANRWAFGILSTAPPTAMDKERHDTDTGLQFLLRSRIAIDPIIILRVSGSFDDSPTLDCFAPSGFSRNIREKMEQHL
jgi:hypothetical protein